MSGLVRSFNTGIYSDNLNVIIVKLCMMSLLVELYLFISLSVTLTIFQSHSNVELLHLKILCSYPIETLYNHWLHQVDHEYIFIFLFLHMFDGDNVFPCLQKKLTLPFSRRLLNEMFQTLHDYNLAQGLHFHCRFDDLDFVTRSQLCQKYILQIVL